MRLDQLFGSARLIVAMVSAMAALGLPLVTAQAQDVADSESADVPGTVVSRTAHSGAVTVDALLLRRSSLSDVPFTKRGENNTSGALATRFGTFTSSELDRSNFGEGLRATVNGTVLDQKFELMGFYMNPISYDKTKLGLRLVSPGNSATINTDAIYDAFGPGSADTTISHTYPLTSGAIVWCISLDLELSHDRTSP